jgi:hypothetical protein
MTKTAPLEKISQKIRKNWRKIRDGAATPIQRTWNGFVNAVSVTNDP